MNLCPEYRYILDCCLFLKKKNLIKKAWSFNGVIYIKKSESDREKPKRIIHYDDISFYVPNSYKILESLIVFYA